MANPSKVIILNNELDIAQEVSFVIKKTIEKNEKINKKTVLCLPSGNTPLKIYKELVRIYREEKFSFKNVIIFLSFEYHPMKPDDIHSSFYYIQKHLVSKVDILEENVFIPKGNLKIEEYEEYCKNFEKKIKNLNGFDLTLVGIGRTGHIGANEPGSNKKDHTRIVVLHQKTRLDNSKAFNNDISKVPKTAITLGLGTILKYSKRIILVATKFYKARIIKKTLEEYNTVPTSKCPASFLLTHPKFVCYCDKGAGFLLKQIQSPWEIVRGKDEVNFKWTKELEKRAIIWLSQKTKKPILTLTDEDFGNYGLSSLLYKWEGRIEEKCMNIYNSLASKFHSKLRPLLPIKENDKCLFFTPHPDDTEISMGGTIKIITDDNKGKEPIVAYLTSGSRGVSKSAIKRHLRFTKMTLGLLEEGDDNVILTKLKELESEMKKSEDYKQDSKTIQFLKKNVRKAEALNALEVIGLGKKNARFLDLPFYRTGQNKKSPLSDEDVEIVLNMLLTEKPNHLFICFDLEDPNYTHSICYFACKQAIEKYRELGNQCKLYLYKGAWQEFHPSQIDIFIPITKSILDAKILSIIQHSSQMNQRMFPGDDAREFHDRAKDRNFETAKIVRDLGFPSFYAMEALKCVDSLPDII